jgi:hypothetical protein
MYVNNGITVLMYLDMELNSQYSTVHVVEFFGTLGNDASIAVDEIRVSCYETARPASVGRLVY